MSSRRRLRSVLTRGLTRRGPWPRWLAGQLAVAGGFALLVAGFGYITLATFGWHTPFWPLWLVVTGTVLLQWLLRPAAEPPLEPAEMVDPDRVEPEDRPYPQADRWERRLSMTFGDPVWYGDVVRGRLATLVAERLRQRHGVLLASQPVPARAILGDELFLFLTEDRDDTPDPAELDRMVTQMEAI